MVIFQEERLSNVINPIFSAIKYFHSISGFPFGNNFLKDHVTEAIKRILSHKISKKLSMKMEDLKPNTD